MAARAQAVILWPTGRGLRGCRSRHDSSDPTGNQSLRLGASLDPILRWDDGNHLAVRAVHATPPASGLIFGGGLSSALTQRPSSFPSPTRAE